MKLKGSPSYKTPRTVCSQNSHYDILDLTELPDDYLPRTNYVPACSEAEYRTRTPLVSWVDKGATEPKRVVEYYRLVFRGMIASSLERTLTGAIIAKLSAHTNAARSYAFKSTNDLLSEAAMTASLPFDFILKSTGKQNLHNTLDDFPLLNTSPLVEKSLHLRVLLLNCLTNHFSKLWSESWQGSFSADQWIKSDPRLPCAFFRKLTLEWNRDCALRTDYARRQALVEIDVLASLALGLTLEELLTIYRVQFPVMRQYEADTFYDANGRIVFTASKGLIGVGLPRKAARNDTPCILRYPNETEESKPLGWEDVRDLPTGYKIIRTVIDDTLPGGPREKQITYVAPFDRCNREDDYRQTWKVFEERLNSGEED